MRWVSIRHKYQIYVFFLLIIPVSILSYLLLLSQFRRISEITQKEQLTYLISIKENNINSRISGIEKIMNSYAKDPRLISQNTDEYMSISSEWDSVSRILPGNIIIHYIDKYKYHIISRKSEMSVKPEKFLWYRNNPGTEDITWFEPFKCPIDFQIAISASKKLEREDGEYVGILAVEISLNDFFSSLKYSESQFKANLIIVSNNGKIINLNRSINEPIDYGLMDTDLLKEGEFTLVELLRNEYYFYYIYIDQLDIYLGSLLEKSEVNSYSLKTVALLIVIILICAAFMIMGSLLISNTIIKNITIITNYMKRVSEGNYLIENCVTTNDEFLTLNNFLNSMVDKLSKNINRKEELLALRTNLIHIISHNAATPITILFNNGIELMETYPEDKMIRDMFFASKNLKGLIDNIMLYLRVDKNNLKLCSEIIYIDELTSLTLKMYNIFINSKKIEINYDIEEDLSIEGSYFFVKTVIENLIDNAIKFSKNNSQISIKAYYVNNGLNWIISDSGPGFSGDDIKGMFCEFQTLSARPTGGESSTGLGLYIVKKIMTSIGGEIDLIESEYSGATIRLFFPGNINH